MKIASVFASIKTGGGVENVQAYLSEMCTELGHDFVHILSKNLAPQNPHAGKIISLDSPFIKGFGPKKIFRLFRDAQKIAQICRQEKIDILIGQGDYFYMVTGLAKKLFGFPGKTLAVVHTTIGVWGGIMTKILRIFLGFHDKIIVISKEEQNTFETKYHFPKEKIAHIYNAIDTEKIRKMASENEKRKNPDMFRIINIGRLTYQKGQDRLLRAFDIFSKKFPNSELLILGDGEEKENLLNLKNSLDARKNIHFLGNQENPYIFLKKSDVFVLASHFEGLSIALMEALASHIAIISTNCPTGSAEILDNGKCGILVDYQNNTEQELADAMERLYLDENLRNNLQENAKKRVKIFEKETIKKEWEKLLFSLHSSK